MLSRKKSGIPFQALQDISFSVYPGEVMGIIGPNGAGKSTLLRIIAGMLEPTSGEVKLHGKVHALFELSSGFNPGLSGKDNVYQKASLMGLSKAEIDARFDDITAFAEIGDFIDQPLMTYSLGMQSRLAFAVATIIDSDIFLIDEILAVGDEYFQGQCRRRISDLVKKGKAAIVVTHDLVAYLRLCSRGLYLEKGKIIAEGNTLQTGECYISTFSSYTAPRPSGMEIERLEIIQQPGELTVRTHYKASKQIDDLDISVAIEKIDPLIGWETCLLETNFNSNFKVEKIQGGETGYIEMKCSPRLLTGKGRYYVSASVRPATGSMIRPAPMYDAIGWTVKDFDSYFDIENGSEAVFTCPVRWSQLPIEIKGKGQRS
jgi:ABC-type polysaccharide/polyol phosphate transport system ATPase subunit